jgi:hypothetical protein
MCSVEMVLNLVIASDLSAAVPMWCIGTKVEAKQSQSLKNKDCHGPSGPRNDNNSMFSTEHDKYLIAACVCG